MTVKYGVLSTASIIGRFIQGVKDSRDGEVVAICSRSMAKAKKACESFGVQKAYDNYEQMLNDDIDVIYIATPNSLHYYDALRAIKAKKHVILEKPFVLTKTQAEHLFMVASENKVFLMEAQKIVFLPITDKVKEIIETNKLGKINYINMAATFAGRFDYDHWMFSLDHGGGCLYGSVSYTIEYLQHLFKVKTITYNGLQKVAPTGVDEACQLNFLVNEKILVTSCIAMGFVAKNVAMIYGDKGYIEVEDYWKARGMKVVVDGVEEIIEIPCPCEFVYEVDHVNDCIDKKLLTSPIMTKENSIQTMEITENIFRSWNPNYVREYEKIEK